MRTEALAERFLSPDLPTMALDVVFGLEGVLEGGGWDAVREDLLDRLRFATLNGGLNSTSQWTEKLLVVSNLRFAPFPTIFKPSHVSHPRAS